MMTRTIRRTLPALALAGALLLGACGQSETQKLQSDLEHGDDSYNQLQWCEGHSNRVESEAADRGWLPPYTEAEITEACTAAFEVSR